MKPKVLPVIAQVVLLATAVLPAQSQPSNRIEDLQARSWRFVTPLSTGAASAQYGLAAIERQSWNGSGWIPQSQTTHTYNGVIRRETLDYNWSFNQWKPTYRTVYRTDGLEEFVDEWNAAANKYEPSERYLYEFEYDFLNQRSAVASILIQQWNGSAWQNSERTTNTIVRDPSAGLLIVGGLNETWNGSGWTRVDDYAIQQTGEDVVQTSRQWDSFAGQWVNWERTTFRSTTIPALHTRLAQLVGEFAHFGDLTIGFLMAPDYENETWSDSPGEWTPDSRRTTTAFHFSSGKPAVVVYESWDGEDWVEDMRHEIQYTLEGRYVKSEATFGGFGGFAETYVYDDLGNITEAVNTLADGGRTSNFARFLLHWANLSTGTDGPGEVPAAHVLNPAYPNPFNPTTTLAYELSGSERVTIRVYDILGRHLETLVDGVQSAGRHKVVFDAAGLPSGLYAVRMQTGQGVQSRTVALVK